MDNWRKLADAACSVTDDCALHVFMKMIVETRETAHLHYKVSAGDILSGLDTVKAWLLTIAQPPYDSDAHLRADLNRATDRVVEMVLTARGAREARENLQ